MHLPSQSPIPLLSPQTEAQTPQTHPTTIRLAQNRTLGDKIDRKRKTSTPKNMMKRGRKDLPGLNRKIKVKRIKEIDLEKPLSRR